MVQELEQCPDPAVRNNVVVVMTDLCVSERLANGPIQYN